MVQTLKPLDSGEADYVVVRPICIGGKRVEVGASVSLTKVQGTELAAASKVALEGTPAAKAAQDTARAAARAAKAAAAKAAEEAAAKAASEAQAPGDTSSTNPNKEPAP